MISAVLSATSDARSSLPVEEGAAEAAQLKNCLTTAFRALARLPQPTGMRASGKSPTRVYTRKDQCASSPARLHAPT